MPLPTLPPLSDAWWAQTDANIAAGAESDLPTLDAPIRPTTASAPATAATSTTLPGLSYGATLGGKVINTVTGGIGGFFSQYIGQSVAVLLGLLLIAAGVFSFDRVQTIAVGAGKEFGKSALEM